MAVTVRGSGIAYVNNANSVVFPLPAGSVAGDTCFVAVSHGFAVTTPAGWASVDNSAGTNVNGATFWKRLVAADIAAGSITITFSGVYYGIVAGISFVGSIVMRSAGQFSRFSSGAGPRSLTEPNAATGDYAIHFAGMRLNNTITSSRGANLQTSSNLNASGILYGELLAATGSITETFTFGAAPTGDYEAVVVVKADDGTTQVPVQEVVRQTLLTTAGTIRMDEIARLTLMQKNGLISMEELARLTLIELNGQLKIHEAVRLVLWSGVVAQQLNVHDIVRLVLFTPGTAHHRRMSLL